MEVSFLYSKLNDILNKKFALIKDKHDIVCLKIDESFCVIWSKTPIFGIIDDLLRVKYEEKKFIPGVGAKTYQKDMLYFDSFELQGITFFIFSNSFFKSVYCSLKKVSENIYQDIYEPQKALTTETALAFIEQLGTKFCPMPHQLECFIKSINEKRLSNQSATSSGKSFIIYLICRYMIAQNMKTILIVPNISLLKQMENDFLSYGWENKHTISKIGGENIKVRALNFSVVITTWQSLIKESFPYKMTDFNCCIIDECHSLRNNGNMLREFLLPKTGELEYRFGFSGTIPNNNLLRYNIVSFCGEVNDVIDVKQLINEDKAANVKIKIVKLHHDRKMFNDFVSKTFSSKLRYELENDFLEQSLSRTEYIANLILRMKKVGNVLCLHKGVNYGFKMLYHLMRFLLNENKIECVFEDKDFTLTSQMRKYVIFTESRNAYVKYNKRISSETIISADDLGIFYINGNILGDRREFIRSYMQNHNNCVLFGTYQCMSTGVNIPNLDALVYAQSVKSEITINQSIGRMLRKHSGKEMAVVADIVDVFRNSKVTTYSEKHFQERELIYKNNDFDITYIDRNI